jgi:hypothetical protein
MFDIAHLNATYHIIAYLKRHESGACIIFDSKEPQFDLHHAFNTDADWSDFYGKVVEELPPHMPKPKGKPIMTFVLLMLTTQKMLLLDARILAYCCMRTMHRYSGTRICKIP